MFGMCRPIKETTSLGHVEMTNCQESLTSGGKLMGKYLYELVGLAEVKISVDDKQPRGANEHVGVIKMHGKEFISL